MASVLAEGADRLRFRVAAGVLVDAAGRVLIARRPADKHAGGAWEFPGGKLQAGESPRQALNRELFEELGVRIVSAAPMSICRTVGERVQPGPTMQRKMATCMCVRLLLGRCLFHLCSQQQRLQVSALVRTPITAAFDTADMAPSRLCKLSAKNKSPGSQR